MHSPGKKASYYGELHKQVSLQKSCTYVDLSINVHIHKRLGGINSMNRQLHGTLCADEVTGISVLSCWPCCQCLASHVSCKLGSLAASLAG